MYRYRLMFSAVLSPTNRKIGKSWWESRLLCGVVAGMFEKFRSSLVLLWGIAGVRCRNVVERRALAIVGFSIYCSSAFTDRDHVDHAGFRMTSRTDNSVLE